MMKTPVPHDAGERRYFELLGSGHDSEEVATLLLSVVSEDGYRWTAWICRCRWTRIWASIRSSVEILSAIREVADAPVVKPEHPAHFTRSKTRRLPRGIVSENAATTKIPMLDERGLTPKPMRRRWTGPAGRRAVLIYRSYRRDSPGAKAPAVCRSNRAARQPIQFGSERVDRSILQVVDLDPGANRTSPPLPPGGEFWVVADAEPLTDAIASQLKSRA